MIQNERYLTLIIKSEMKTLSKVEIFDVLRRASTKKISKLSVSERDSSSTSLFTLSLLIFLVLAREEHQNFELLKELQKARISDLIINVKYRSFRVILVEIESA
jgi:hypothetical protein